MFNITYRVNCMRDYGKIYSMTIYVTKLNDGSYLPSPCNGCDKLNASPECNRCIDKLFKLSVKDPSMQSFKQPITP